VSPRATPPFRRIAPTAFQAAPIAEALDAPDGAFVRSGDTFLRESQKGQEMTHQMTRHMRVRCGIVVAAALLSVTALATGQQPISPDLQTLVETERAFAKTATLKGLRDSFLEYFADDAIALTPGAVSAKDRLRAQPAVPFSVLEIVWEPRTGDVAASHDLGWLTGPSTIVDHSAPQPAPRHGNYLSVWRRQPDGRWRVFIDVGVRLPGPAPFAPGFVRTPMATRYTGNDGKEAATRALLDADRTLNEAMGSAGVDKAYAERLTSASRLHRVGVLPVVGTTAIRSWLTEHAGAMTARVTAGEASAAGDFGYTYGTYEMKPPGGEAGAYVRVWMRDAAGKWLIVADVTQPS
jgi:ketosteroid isomerase-like protein